jgi:hypothetical protein
MFMMLLSMCRVSTKLNIFRLNVPEGVTES